MHHHLCQHHLVVWCAKLTINEFPVVDCHPTDTPNEPEVTEVVLTASP